MKNFKEHIISSKATILDALNRIDKISQEEQVLTLFVCDDNEKMVGTLTDGDIRRGFIQGYAVDSLIEQVMTKKFVFVDANFIDVKQISNYRKEGIKLLPFLSKEGHIERVFNLQEMKSILPVECMIMAGGRGERLRPLTDTKPKPMLQLGEKPIIEHNIDRLIQFGVQKIYISIRYLGDQIVDYLGDGSEKGIEIQYVRETEPLGTGGALRLVSSFNTDYVLLMNSDLFTDIDFEDLYLETLAQKASIGIASTPYTVNIPYAIFERNDSKILSFKEKPSNTHYANAGIYLIKKEWLELIPKNQFFNITDLIQLLLDKNEHVIHNPIPGYWIDIGKHEDFDRAKSILDHIRV